MLVLVAYFSTSLMDLAVVVFAEAFAHYHLDWLNMNITRKMNWACNTPEQFWTLTCFDQLLHYLTYVAMVWYLVRPA